MDAEAKLRIEQLMEEQLKKFTEIKTIVEQILIFHFQNH